ncbi:putative B3 domain-containing protein At1g78640 [Hevea brasiliensis]|uniref:putative B3 domain-containing protein At1g78640 n=1 Tax=Hevea brasiliensis TaxID=3981 RepID=UPI0025DB1E0C|nr:putative B3 domain-containing protein At1g78640 [Hevea brasiliensis]
MANRDLVRRDGKEGMVGCSGDVGETLDSQKQVTVISRMEKQHFKPLVSFSASIAQEAKKDQFLAAEPSDKKRKYQHNSEGEKKSGVSTELTLSCGVPSKINKPRIEEINSSADNEKFLLNSIVVSTRPENEVSTEIKIFDESWFAAFAATREETVMLSDPWKIKKKLTGSDLGNLCRLLVASLSVRNHILPLLRRETLEQIEKDGAAVPIWDCDTNTEQHMVLKHWRSSKSYVFIKGWMIQFVKRRNLVEGDLIGIYWDPSNSRFNFSVLERA